MVLLTSVLVWLLEPISLISCHDWAGKDPVRLFVLLYLVEHLYSFREPTKTLLILIA